MRGERPYGSISLGSAPFSSSKDTILSYPLALAPIRGETPSSTSEELVEE